MCKNKFNKVLAIVFGFRLSSSCPVKKPWRRRHFARRFATPPAEMASRILANLIVSGGQVLLRAAAAAYQKALVSACPPFASRHATTSRAESSADPRAPREPTPHPPTR
jgi:hypothetical protein